MLWKKEIGGWKSGVLQRFVLAPGGSLNIGLDNVNGDLLASLNLDLSII